MGWGPGPAKGDQNFQNIVTSPPENPTENEKRFFSMSSRRPAESIKGLNSSLVLAAGDL